MTIFYHFNASSFIHSLVVTFDILDLCVTCVCVRIIVCLHSSKGIQSLNHFQVTYIQLRSFVIQTSLVIYIDLAKSCPLFFLGDLHPFKESFHLGFVSNLHPSWWNLITQPFFGDLHPFKELCHLGFVSDLNLSWRNLITQPFFGDLHPFKESCHLGLVSDLHPSWWHLITYPFFGDLYPFKESCHLLLERFLNAMSF